MDTFSSKPARAPFDSVRLILGGWAGLVAFGAIVAVTIGRAKPSELAFAAATIATSLVLAAWLWKRPGRAALVGSLILGGLQLLEQTGYSVADLTDSGSNTGTTLADLFGLVASAAVVTGAVIGLAQRRHAKKNAVPTT
jgi:hypothetical protein